ncbi:MAG: hypothetical protein M1826_007784 [Phylliscum demangeonii]|nr:MAG: hypothetical protein M1826_007784 [Phylliscum demangeonii]
MTDRGRPGDSSRRGRKRSADANPGRRRGGHGHGPPQTQPQPQPPAPHHDAGASGTPAPPPPARPPYVYPRPSLAPNPLPGPGLAPPGVTPPGLRPLKVAIPRLPVEPEASYTSAPTPPTPDRPRIAHACEPCRSRKTKCTGERPRCGHCVEHGLLCLYADGKRDRARKEMGDLQERVEAYEKLLDRLNVHGDQDTRDAIAKVRRRPDFPGELPDGMEPIGQSEQAAARGRPRPSRPDSPAPAPEPEAEEEAGEDLVSAEVGSTGSGDAIEQDFNEDADAARTGYLGKNTAVSWMQGIAARLQGDPPTEDARWLASAPPAPSRAMPDRREPQLSDFDYDADDIELTMPDPVHDLDLPPRAVADVLVQAYFDTVHDSFPMLLRAEFFQAYDRSFRPVGPDVDRRWRARLNLVLAIGAKHVALTRGRDYGRREHCIFFARARSLSLDGGALWHVGDLEHVQLMGLTTLYLMAAEHVSRAWYICSMAVRSGQGLGLHLRNHVKSPMTDVEKEFRVRLWWSIYGLERLLEVGTGRPSAIEDSYLSLLLPIALPEEAFPPTGGRLFDDPPRSPGPARRTVPDRASTSPGTGPGPGPATGPVHPTLSARTLPSEHGVRPDTLEGLPAVANSATYLIHRLRLDMIGGVILKTLFSPQIAGRSWGDVQASINDLQGQLATWRHELPTLFDFGGRQREPTAARERLSLGFAYWSLMQVTTRPCLCQSAHKIPNQSARSKQLNQAMAVLCIRAARECLNFLPDEPNASRLYGIGPWWRMVHYLVQAAAALLTELVLKAEHLPREVHELLAQAKKAIRWLWSLAASSSAAARAWRLMDQLLRQTAPLVGGDTSDMPAHHPSPADRPLVARPVPAGPMPYYPGPTPAPAPIPVPVPLYWQEADAHAHPSAHLGFDPFFQPAVFSSYDQFNALGSAFADHNYVFPPPDPGAGSMEME